MAMMIERVKLASSISMAWLIPIHSLAMTNLNMAVETLLADMMRLQNGIKPSMLDVVIEKVQIKAGEKIRFEESYKYSKSNSSKLWQSSGFVTRAVLKNASDDYSK